MIHAQRADREGNVQLWGITGIQKEAVLAARAAVVTVEEVVDVLEPRPGAVFLPAWTIDAVSVAPGGAHPSYAHGYTERDNDFYVAWAAISRDRDAFRRLDGGACPRRLRRVAATASEWTPAEMMTVAAARALPDGATCLVGIGLPSTAANVARRLHAPRLVLVYESGTIGSKPASLPLSIGDGILAETADTVVGVPEMFNYWLQPGRLDIGFLGAAQLDRYANINTTVVGDYEHPDVRLPGAGGAPEIASSCREVIIVVRHGPDKLVETVDFVTSVGLRARAGRPGAARPPRWRADERDHRPRSARSRPGGRASSCSPTSIRA